MRTRALVTFAVAVTLAGISVALAHAWLTSVQVQQPASAAADRTGDIDTLPLVVAARSLRYGDRLGPGDIRLVQWPKSAVPAGALHSLEQLTGFPGDLEPIVLRPIEAREPVLTSKITGFGAPARLAATIGPGMRAATVSMGSASEMAALIGPGDRVDVLIARDAPAGGRNRELRSDVLLRDVRVLGLDQDAGGPSSSKQRPRPVTLEVTVEQAQKLAIAHKIGTLSLALRGVEGGDAGASRPISSRDLPAGLAFEAGWDMAKPAETPVAQFLAGNSAVARPKLSGASVRVFRGLDASEYEVAPEDAPEDPAGPARAIDAAKSSPGKTGRGVLK